ncbi:flippase-like domain-containing protein [Ginsengibacter hankyongi]|uniref:Flippase-like domain-containing protein n=1 Tax=Ginsengibacter hankyongi TaxID=2607284 RepID=A0A5J5ICC9_9BACT|nr:lysylphosphatidylglycerol synthase transmembrane domain-containing protein [Ginsengibacter hankyongi]KAA9034667.1 flippase-like domain-containing protein [Ginsengibacter hankyongi]
MRKKITAILQYLVFLGIGIFLTWWQFSKMTNVERVQFRESLLHANYIVIIPIAIVAILSHISRAMRWKIMIEPMGYYPSTSNTFYSVMCGYFANTFLPRAGEILRCTLLSRYEKIPVNKLIGTILIERVFDLFCYFLIIIFTIAVQINTVKEFIKKSFQNITHKNVNFPFWELLIAIIVFGTLVFFVTRWIFKKYGAHRHIIKLKGIHIGLKEGFMSIIRLKKRRAFILHSIFIWSMYLLEIYIGFSALKATSGLGIAAGLSVLSLATLAMIVSPGGIGAFPVAIQQVLLIYSIDNISFGWLIWGTTTALIIVIGLVSFGLLIYTNRNKNETKQ